MHLMIWNRIIRDFKVYTGIEDRITELLLGTKISVMLHVVKPCSMETPGMTHIGVGEMVERGMPVTMRVIGKLEFGEVNAVGPRTLLVFADLGGMNVPVDVAGNEPAENEKHVLLAEMAGEPDGIVMFVEGAGEADGTVAALEVPSNDERVRVLHCRLIARASPRPCRRRHPVAESLSRAYLFRWPIGETETMIVPLEVSDDSDARKLVVFVGRVGEAEGTIITLEVDNPELAGKKTVDKLVSVSFGDGTSEMVLVVSGNIALTVTVVMPAVTVRLYLVVVNRCLAVRVLVCRRFFLANLRDIYGKGFLPLLPFRNRERSWLEIQATASTGKSEKKIVLSRAIRNLSSSGNSFKERSKIDCVRGTFPIFIEGGSINGSQGDSSRRGGNRECRWYADGDSGCYKGRRSSGLFSTTFQAKKLIFFVFFVFGRVKDRPSERCCQVRVIDVRHLQISSAEFLGSFTVGLKSY